MGSRTNERILIEGLLKKKSPKTFLGRPIWQERYFVLTFTQLCYYKRKEDIGDEDKCLGYLLIENISGAVEEVYKGGGLRFNLLLEGVERQFELEAPSRSLTLDWIKAVKEALKKYGKQPISLLSPTNGSAAGKSDSKFWKPQIHKKIIMQRRQAISAEYINDSAAIEDNANRVYAKTPTERSLVMGALRTCMAFKIMDDTALSEVCELMWETSFQKGEYICTKNQSVSHFHVIMSGSLVAQNDINNNNNNSGSNNDTLSKHQSDLQNTSFSNDHILLPSPASITRTTMTGSASSGTGRDSMNYGQQHHLPTASPSFTASSSSFISPDLLLSRPSISSSSSEALLTPGVSFGEIALLYDSLATHTLVARETTKCFTLDRSRYKKLVAAASQKMYTQRITFLRSVPIFRHLPSSFLNQISEAFEQANFQSGDTIFREGDQPDAFYIIQEGTVQLTRGTDNTQICLCNTPGTFFGERACIFGIPRIATATVLTPARTLYLALSDFELVYQTLQKQFLTKLRQYPRLDGVVYDPSEDPAIDEQSPVPTPTAASIKTATQQQQQQQQYTTTTKTDTSLPSDHDLPPPPPEDDDLPPPPPPPHDEDESIIAHVSQPATTPSATSTTTLPKHTVSFCDDDDDEDDDDDVDLDDMGPQFHKRITIVTSADDSDGDNGYQTYKSTTPLSNLPSADTLPRGDVPSGFPTFGSIKQQQSRAAGLHLDDNLNDSQQYDDDEGAGIAQEAQDFFNYDHKAKLKAQQEAFGADKPIPAHMQRQSVLPQDAVARKNKTRLYQFGNGPGHVCTVNTLKDLKILGTLGRGTFGHVQLAQHNNATYALKAVNKAHVVRHNQVPHILNERAVMLELDHPFIVKLYRTLRDNDFLYFLLEPSLGGELFSVLRNADKFDNDTARFYSAIVVTVFQYMHGKNILYRDLKPENLLMDPDGYIRVTDFGFAKQTQDRTWTFCGTPDYLAPEIVASAGHHYGADWWCLGILIFEMLAGYTPFYDEGGVSQMYTKILAGKIYYPPFFQPAARDIIASLLQIKPTRRLGALMGKDAGQIIRQHAWFTNLDWDKLYQRELQAPIAINIKDRFDLSNFDAYMDDDHETGHFEPNPEDPWDLVF